MNPHNIMDFPPDKATVIALKYRTGKPGRNQIGDFFTYSLTNGKLAFLPPAANEAVQSLHLGPQEAFQITRRKAGSWEVERLPQELTDAPATLPEIRSARLGSPHSGTTNTPEHITAAIAVSSPVHESVSTPESERLARQLKAATRAVADAQAYARSIGLSVEFRASDIRALAISGFISQGRF
jgi:hypothetical protein